MTLGRIASIWRYPVKSMLGEELNVAFIGARGLAGDRVYALIDNETGKVVSVKRPQRWSRIFELQAFSSNAAGAIWVRFPGENSFSIDDSSLPTRLREFLGRPVSISSLPPPNAHFDETWVRELKNGAGTYYGRPSHFEDGEEIVEAGSSMGRDGNFFNDSPIHIVTTSTLHALAEAAPASHFDAQRFRPNIVIDTPGEGFVENEWLGSTISIGSVEFSVTMTVPRCVMTTLAQGNLPRDPDILRAITANNAIDALSTGIHYPCVGVYAQVLHAGTVRIGDDALLA
jgi:uncharacterized protein YcbX